MLSEYVIWLWQKQQTDGTTIFLSFLGMQVNMTKLLDFSWFKTLFSNFLTFPWLENLKLIFQVFHGS